jgi:hypothetical protein
MPTTQPYTAEPRQLVLVKQRQRWVFRYMPGEEQAVLNWLARTARDPAADFNWFDAAVLSHQMGTRMEDKLKSMLED